MLGISPFIYLNLKIRKRGRQALRVHDAAKQRKTLNTSRIKGYALSCISTPIMIQVTFFAQK